MLTETTGRTETTCPTPYADRVRVLIVDDHEMFATSLARLLADAEDIDVLGTCTTLVSLPDRLRSDQPDLVLADWNLPGGSGTDVIATVRREAPEARVVVLTGESGNGVVRAALAAGCDGFVTKDRAPEELLGALRAAARGEVQLTAAAARELGSGSVSPTSDLGLSQREIEVVALLAASRTNREIADELYLSANTVRNHVQRIARKLGVSTRMEIVVRASEAGLVELSTRRESATDQRSE